MNCGNELKKQWSSQWTQFMQLRKKPEKKNIQDFNGVWTRVLAIPVRCSTNWAMKPLTLGEGQLWVRMFPWKKWLLMIYEINHIWTHSWPAPNVSGFIAQLVENRTGIARSRFQTPLKSWFFSGFFTQLHKFRSLRRSFLFQKNICSYLSNVTYERNSLVY